jgi:hypothetical protein
VFAKVNGRLGKDEGLRKGVAKGLERQFAAFAPKAAANAR